MSNAIVDEVKSWTKTDVRTILAVVWSVAAIIYVGLVTFLPIPEQSIRIVDTTLGFVLGTIVATIIGFYFGSSQGSADKNKLIKGD